MVKTAKKDISIKIPEQADPRNEKEEVKKVERIKFARKSLLFIL